MRKYDHSKNSVFLLELLINIILFSVLVVIGLQFFIRAHSLTTKTTNLHKAVTLSSSVAELYEYGGIEAVKNAFPNSTDMDYESIIYYDKEFNECKKKKAHYFLYVISDNSRASTQKADILFCNSLQDEIYSFTAHYYEPLTPSYKEVN